MTRRNLRTVSVSLVLLLSVGSSWSATLTHGPITGGVTSTEANVFVRTSGAATVALRYGTDPTLSTFLTTDGLVTDVDADFTKIIPLAGLGAESHYYLDVMVNGISQSTAPYPTFLTHPPEGSFRDFKFAVLTDFVTVSSLTRSYRTFKSVAETSPAFVFLGGDFDHRNPPGLADKRQMFKELYNPNTSFMTDFVPMVLQRYAIARQWDDHDSGLNNSDKTYPGWPLTQKAFQEYTPLYPLPSVTPGIWQKFSYAQADCFILDGRSQRDPGLERDGPDKSMLDGNNLGAVGQLEWLKNGLLNSTARWKIIFTSVVTNSTTKLTDAWAAYPTEWSILRNFINSNNISNVVFIAGDLHLAAIDNGSISGFPEMCVAQPNSEGVDDCATGSRGSWSEGYYESTCAGFGLVTVLQNPDRLVLEAADELGQIRLSYTVTAGATPTPTPTPYPPAIEIPPADKIVKVGATAKFTVTATGTAPLNYQWRKNGSDISGAVGSVYTTPPTVAGDDGSLFQVVVSNVAGSVTSDSAKLTIYLPPSITVQPQDQTVREGKRALFTVTANGTPAPKYQWRKNGVIITGATGSSYRTPATGSADDGALFSVSVTNKLGSVTSNDAILRVVP